MTTTAEEVPAMPVEAGAPERAADAQRVLRLAMRIAVVTLASGAQTYDVEASIVTVARAYGVDDVQAAVTFSTISVSYYAGPDEPATTLLHLVRDRTTDFTRLAGASDLTRRIRSGHLALAEAETELNGLEQARPDYRQAVRFAAPGLSAAGSTLVLGGNLMDAIVTLLIALVIQPVLIWLAASTMPTFFRIAIGAASSTLFVALLVASGLQISEGLVLTGSLLRFLPGYALVAGFRDLIDGSMVSGTARLAEALLLAAAVAAGTGFSLAIASTFGVNLGIAAAGQVAWGLPVSVAASVLAVGAYAIQLGAPARAMAQAAVVGAIAWAVYRTFAIPYGPIEPALATFVATVLIGIFGRVLARRLGGVAALWVVPAILPFLPGLLLVQAMLAKTEAAQITGLVGAATAAFLIGIGVATGDIVVLAIRGVRDQIVAPAVGMVVGGVDVVIVGPVGRAVDRVRQRDPAHAAPAATSNGPLERRPKGDPDDP
jgi:uncharacterized membrane protein YjjP (DUF1212 family)